MSFSLYDALVPSWLQILKSVACLMDKAQAHCTEQGIEPKVLISSRLAPDMHPLGYQVKSTEVHSIGAIEAARRGACTPDRSPWPETFAGLRARVEAAAARLSEIDPVEVNALVGRALWFEVGAYKADFIAEKFLLSFSQPNFFFHATTAYGILRSQGVAIGKVDFLGKMREEP